MNVAFYLDNSRISIDYSTFLDGNPGIGGTEHLFLVTTYLLQKRYEKDKDIVLLLQKDMSLPDDYKYVVVGSKADAIAYCIKENIQTLIVKFENKDYVPNLFKSVPANVDVIVWAHNVIPLHLLNVIAKTPRIKQVVNVGREQLDLYRDHRAFLKSTFIYNAVDIKSKEYYKEHSIPFSKRKHEVTYLGSLVQAKGFHVLAKAWKAVVEAVPDAHLSVIGSATVYVNAKLGKYGLSEESYEQEFMPYLTDTEGNIMPSVTFHGRMGEEKNEILARTKVGVPNPSGFTETFCLSAVEMALYGAKIATKRYVGFLDTVPESAGILVDDPDKELASAIIQLLQKDDNKEYDTYYQYCQDNFSYDKVIVQWHQLLTGSKTSTQNVINRDYNYKGLRETNRKIKSLLPFGYSLPTIDFYIFLMNKIFNTDIKIQY